MNFNKKSLLVLCLFACIVSCTTKEEVETKTIDAREFMDNKKKEIEAELKGKLAEKISKQFALKGLQPSGNSGGSTSGECQAWISIDNIELGDMFLPNYVVGFYTPYNDCSNGTPSPNDDCDLYNLEITNNCPTPAFPWLDPACFPSVTGPDPDNLDGFNYGGPHPSDPGGDLNCALEYGDALSFVLVGYQLSEDCGSSFADLDVTITVTITICDAPGQAEYCIPSSGGNSTSASGGLCYVETYTLAYDGTPTSLDLQLGSGNLNDRCGCSFSQI